MAIVDLAVHPYAFVTVAELACYWRLPNRAVLDYIYGGGLEAIRFGPGVYRIRTKTALEFERRALVAPHYKKPAVIALAPAPVTPAPLRTEESGESVEWGIVHCSGSTPHT
jgi:hypothetical protein